MAVQTLVMCEPIVSATAHFGGFPPVRSRAQISRDLELNSNYDRDPRCSRKVA